MARSPEKEASTNEPTDHLKLKLSASQNACRLLQEHVFDLESRLQKINAQIEQSKAEAKMNAKALAKCKEEKSEMVGYCKRLASLCNDLERECAAYESDLQRYMESLEENRMENEELYAISLQEHQSEVEKLKAEIEAMKKDRQRLRTNITQAEQEVIKLSRGNKFLQERHDHLMAIIKNCQQEKSTKPESEQFVGRPN
ncbi:SKIP interacting protein 16 [Rhynchospora pubera]|uniref:SKIP interacting protein 16 n=1 Tax=Rhynchospora pubera TaxID=906938 RepID=A0AAV8E9W1_9POAL|nr:SKIP interacting protein 16 [Rhynchospora pubera]